MLKTLREQWYALSSSQVVRQVRKRRLTYLGYDAAGKLTSVTQRVNPAQSATICSRLRHSRPLRSGGSKTAATVCTDSSVFPANRR